MKNRSKNNFNLFLLVLFALCLFMIMWCGPVSEYAGHDFYFHFIRFKVLINNLQSGQYPIYLDTSVFENYGYFTKAFYPDLLLLPFAALGIITGPVFAYNVMLFVITFLCGLFMYQFVNTVFNNQYIASVSAILYTFSTYRLYDTFQRGALGETFSFTFIPIIFLGLYHIIKGDYKKWYILTIGYSLLLYNHMLSSFMTVSAALIIVLINYKLLLKEPKRIAFLILSAIVTIAVVASYLFPMLEQMESNTFYYSTFENITGQTKVKFTDMLWGFLSGFAYPDRSLPGLGLLLVCLLPLRLFIKEKTQYLKIADTSLIIGLLYMLILSSLFPWGRLPLGFIQFPWRFYEFASLFFAVSGSYYLYAVIKSQKQRNIAAAVILVLTVIVIVNNNTNYLKWQTHLKKEMPEMLVKEASVENRYYMGGFEYLPIKVPSYLFFKERGDTIITNNMDTKISNYRKKDGIINFNVATNKPDKLELPLVYYKGYTAVSNDKSLPLDVTESNQGLVEITVNKSDEILVYYGGTVIQKVSWYISIVSIIGLCIYIFSRVRKNKKAI